MPYKRLFLLALLFLSAPIPAARAQEDAPDGVPMLQPGDMLKIDVWRKDEMSGEFMVAADSTLLHPLYKAVKVAGIPFSEATARMRALLQQYEAQPEFVLQPQYSVYVGGDVAKPGMYHFGPETTIARALVEAGGSLNNRDLQRVRLNRGGESVVLNLTKQSGGPALSGDQIFVEGNLIRHVIDDYITPASGLVTTGLLLWQMVGGLF